MAWRDETRRLAILIARQDGSEASSRTRVRTPRRCMNDLKAEKVQRVGESTGFEQRPQTRPSCVDHACSAPHVHPDHDSHVVLECLMQNNGVRKKDELSYVVAGRLAAINQRRFSVTFPSLEEA